MRFVIVTGMSGAGKSTALKMLEDVGYYCVDNLPISLISKFAELTYAPSSEITKVAPVSYTHLDVYKRQLTTCAKTNTGKCIWNGTIGIPL